MQQHNPKEPHGSTASTRHQPAPPRGEGPDSPIEGRCNAQLRGKPDRMCRQWQGARTDHKGTGRCWLHGGASPGAPKGNNNGGKHGLSRRQLLVHYRPSMRKLLEHAQEAVRHESESDRLKGRILDELAWCDAAEAQVEIDWLALEERVDKAGGDKTQLPTSRFGIVLEERIASIKRRRIALHRLYLDTLKTMVDLGLISDEELEEIGELVLGRSAVGQPLDPIHVHPGSSLEDVRAALGLPGPPAPKQIQEDTDAVADPEP